MVKKIMINLNIPWFNSIKLVILLVVLLLPYTSAQSDILEYRRHKHYYETSDLEGRILIFLLFVCAIGICFCRQNDIPDDAAGETPSKEGLDSAVIETFPVFFYRDVKNLKKVHNIEGTGLDCAICLKAFEDEDMLRLLPCDHVFCPRCIGKWFVSHSTCPYCRRDLKKMVTDETAPNAGDAVIDVSGDDENHSEGTAMVVSDTEHEENSLVYILEQVEDFIAKNIPDNQMHLIDANQHRARSLQRSHTTGHSLIQGLENSKRHTLLLPDHVRKDILRQKLQSNRGKNFLTTISDRWVVPVAPRLFGRSSSCL